MTSPESENVIVIYELTPVEFFSALLRRQREGVLTPENSQLLQTAFLEHYQKAYLAIALDSRVLIGARELIKITHCEPLTLFNWHRLLS